MMLRGVKMKIKLRTRHKNRRNLEMGYTEAEFDSIEDVQDYLLRENKAHLMTPYTWYAEMEDGTLIEAM